MTFMRKLLDILNMDNWNSNCTVPRDIDEYFPNDRKMSNSLPSSPRTEQKDDKCSKSSKLAVSDAFLWQCNSISTLRDSDDVGYEYTNLDNPNDPLETGYRDALLDISNYNTLPLIDHSKDKYALGGYVPRKFFITKFP